MEAQTNATPDDPVLMMHWNNMVQRYGNDITLWPNVGCGCKYIPSALGPGLVCEVDGPEGETIAFLAEQIPEAIDDQIKAHQTHWDDATRRLTLEQLESVMPITFPQNQL